MIGRPLAPLPERGFNVGISVPTLDVGYWQELLQSSGKEPGSASGLPVSVDLKADEVILLGASYTRVSVGVSGATSQWRGTVQSDQAVGSFVWDGSGTGKLKAQFKKWRRPEKVSKDAEPGEALKESAGARHRGR
jgi:uncharacterized protein YhdP